MRIGSLVKLKPQWTASKEPIFGVVTNLGIDEYACYTDCVQVQWAYNSELIWMAKEKMEIICK